MNPVRIRTRVPARSREEQQDGSETPAREQQGSTSSVAPRCRGAPCQSQQGELAAQAGAGRGAQDGGADQGITEHPHHRPHRQAAPTSRPRRPRGTQLERQLRSADPRSRAHRERHPAAATSRRREPRRPKPNLRRMALQGIVARPRRCQGDDITVVSSAFAIGSGMVER
jgi:hypothetical protein